MAEYKRLNLSELHYAEEPMPLSESLRDVAPFEDPEEAARLLASGHLHAEKDCKNKCVRLATSYLSEMQSPNTETRSVLIRSL